MSSSYIARPASVMREGKAVFDSMQDCLCGYDNAILQILDFRIRQLIYLFHFVNRVDSQRNYLRY